MSKKPQKHRQKVIKQKDHWWSMCTCGWRQGRFNKLDALNDRDRHQEKVKEPT